MVRTSRHRTFFSTRMRGDRGQSSLEYIAGVVLAAIAVAAVIVATPNDMSAPAKRAVCKITLRGNCGEAEPVSRKVPGAGPVGGSKVCWQQTSSGCIYSPNIGPGSGGPLGGRGPVDLCNTGIISSFANSVECDKSPGDIGDIDCDKLIVFDHKVPSCEKPKIEPRAKKGDKCAKGKGKAGPGPETGSGSATTAHTEPVWNIDWTLDPYDSNLRAGWQGMIQQVRQAAAAGNTDQPLTNADATAVGTVTITTNDGRTLTLYMQANDMYIIGWQATDVNGNAGPTYQVNEPDPTRNHNLAALLCPGATTVPFDSNYNTLTNLAGESPRFTINRLSLDTAVHGLADYTGGRDSRRAAAGVLTFATAIAEAARFPQIERAVGGMIEEYPNTFGNDTLQPRDRSLIANWANLSNLALGLRTEPVSYLGGIIRTAAQAAALLALWHVPPGGKPSPRQELPPPTDPPKQDPPPADPTPTDPPKQDPPPDDHGGDPYWCGAPFC